MNHLNLCYWLYSIWDMVMWNFFILRKWENLVHYLVWACQITSVICVRNQNPQRRHVNYSVLSRETKFLSLVHNDLGDLKLTVNWRVEYDWSIFDAYCENYSIIHEVTPSYSP